MRAPTRLFLACASVFRRSARLFEAVAAGTLSRAELRAGIAEEWGDFRRDREEALRGLFEWEEAVLARASGDGRDILLIGSGTGRELIALAARGYRVVAIDPSLPALDVARVLVAERGLSATLLHGFFEDTAVPGVFDLIIFTHRSYGLIQGREVRARALRKAAAQLRPGGRLIVSYLQGHGMHPVFRRAASLAGRLSSSDVEVEAGDDLYWGARGTRGCGFEHHFAADEFAAEAARAGLRVLHSSAGDCPAVVLEPI